MFQHTAARRRLQEELRHARMGHGFNTQPPEGGCPAPGRLAPLRCRVSTHSRPKAAAVIVSNTTTTWKVSTHSRPKAAATEKRGDAADQLVSTHSRPKAAAACAGTDAIKSAFQHTAARRRLRDKRISYDCRLLFQHTAARRRLRACGPKGQKHDHVSTHSRPKAAAGTRTAARHARAGFQHTAARRRLRE